MQQDGYWPIDIERRLEMMHTWSRKCVRVSDDSGSGEVASACSPVCAFLASLIRRKRPRRSASPSPFRSITLPQNKAPDENVLRSSALNNRQLWLTTRGALAKGKKRTNGTLLGTRRVYISVKHLECEAQKQSYNRHPHHHDHHDEDGRS